MSRSDAEGMPAQPQPRNPADTVDSNDPRYPRSGPVFILRSVLLYSWPGIFVYLANAIENAYRAANAGTSDLLTIVRVLFVPALGGAWSPWVSLPFALPLVLILGGYLWARQDQAREARVIQVRDDGAMVSGIVSKAAQRIIREVTTHTTGWEHTGVPRGLPRAGQLVGRADELDRLFQWLKSSDSIGAFAIRGLPSVGKTALAAEVVAQLATDRQTFPGGAYWIPCETLQDQSDLVGLWSTIAQELGIDKISSQIDASARRKALYTTLMDPEHPRLLLALDNIEPSLSVNIIDEILDTLAGGRATVLITARQAVVPGRLQTMELEPLTDAFSTQLFRQQLQQVDPTRPTNADLAELPGLIAELGGLPLALIQAAGYAGLQRRAIGAVTQQVRSDGLASGALDGLLASFERSWRVLNEPQQKLFAGLSLIEGASFPFDAALAVAKTAWAQNESRAMTARAKGNVQRSLDYLISLALIQPLAGERLRLHPLLRDFAEKQLDQMPVEISERLGSAALHYWLRFARQRAIMSKAAHATGTLGYAAGTLGSESPGLMGALLWSYTHSRYQETLELVRTLSPTWAKEGRVDDLRQMLTLGIQGSLSLHDLDSECQFTLELADLHTQVEQYKPAYQHYEKVLAIAREQNDVAARFSALRGIGVIQLATKEYARARAHLKQALELAQEHALGPSDERTVQHTLACIDFEEQRFTTARTGFSAALVLAQRSHDAEAVATETHWLELTDAQIRANAAADGA